jgi:hypothetical protein
MLANASIQNTPALQGLPHCAAFDGFPAIVVASPCPHGWVSAFAGMTRVDLEGESLSGFKRFQGVQGGARL